MAFTTQLEPIGAGAGRNIGQFLMGMATNYVAQGEARKEETKRVNDKAGAFDRLAKSDPSFLQTLQIDEEEWKGLGSREKVQAFDAYAEKMGVDKMRANLAQVQANTDATRASTQRVQTQDEQFAQGLQQLQGLNVPQARGGSGPMGTPMMMGAPQGDQRAAMLQQVMANNPQAAQQIAEMLKAVQGAAQTPATPGAVRSVPGLEGYAFGVQSPSGAGSFLPTGAGGSARSAVAATDMRPADRLNAIKLLGELETQYNDLAATTAENITPDTHRRLKALSGRMQEVRTMLGAPAGSARGAVAGGSEDDPLGIFQ